MPGGCCGLRIIGGVLAALAPGCGDNRPSAAIDATPGRDCGVVDGDCVHTDMIRIPIPGGAYYVDSAETTNAAYAAFLAANPSTTGQPAYCSWNTSYAPLFSITAA